MTERLVTNKGQCVACIGCIEESNCTVECGAIDDCLEKLAEYESAEEDGRLVVLSCKVGDTAYVIENKHIAVFEVNKIELKPKVFGNITYYLEKPSRRGCLCRYYESEHGDKWFVDKEEAKKALKKMEGK